MEHTELKGTDTRVMLVDDDPVILDLLSNGLAEAGYSVDACAEARSALERYNGAPPDVAVLDVGLPDMPGTDLARALMRFEYRPILILSTYNDMDIVQQAIAAGVVGYLVKPASVDQLVPSLETSLSRYRSRGEHVASHLGSEFVSREHLARIMDRFPFALLIIDEHHHAIYRNARARELLRDDVLYIDPAGRLRSRANADDFVPVLDQALGKAAPAQWRTALLDDRPPQRLHAWAAPLFNEPGRARETLAAVAVFSGDHGQRYTWEALKALYGLTRKESSVVNGLLQGLSLEDYCARNFVTANTVRTHLKSIYRKTGTNRQAEVVRLFSSIFMPLET